jgi:hypothetical protein
VGPGVPFGRTIGVGAVVVGRTVVVVGANVVVGATVVVVAGTVVVTGGAVVVLAAFDPPHAASAANARIDSFFTVRTRASYEQRHEV